MTEEILTLVAARLYLKYNILSTCEALLLDIDLGFNLNVSHVAPSYVHGNGVFASKNILEDEIITLYPTHVVFVNVGEHTLNYYKYSAHRKYNLSDCHHYKKSINSELYCGAFPQEHSDRTWIGHLINDGSCKVTEEYQTENLNKTNCRFVKIYDHNEVCYFVAIIATRPITKGDELFIQYGTKYWLNKLRD